MLQPSVPSRSSSSDANGFAALGLTPTLPVAHSATTLTMFVAVSVRIISLPAPVMAVLQLIYSCNHAHMRLPFCVIDKKLTFATP
eukprot:SAG25_NODE_767_length_5466_cov_4.881871_4_plen_85_part_00